VRITEFFLLILLGAVLQLFSPWFSLGLLALVLGYLFRQNAVQAFTTGFLGGFFLWAGYAGYFHFFNEGVLGDRMAKLFNLPAGWLFVIVTGIFGGLLAGLGCWTGQALRQAVDRPRTA
jgi:hypothetical protein